ncbi:hypothetical protein AV530_003538 [Patagioenas fasciata monilis]|uniref:Uncharacterized protein n=1 Tax=Patagioenas fasciata monilis TaxID=372326 RepID=A0A1V4K2T4_PATFA|nr:hypothetical protein AV530_003538 [Patagioenas fasciata monilis]
MQGCCKMKEKEIEEAQVKLLVVLVSKKDFMESCHENEAVMPQQSGNSLGSQFMLPVLKHNRLSEKRYDL